MTECREMILQSQMSSMRLKKPPPVILGGQPETRDYLVILRIFTCKETRLKIKKERCCVRTRPLYCVCAREGAGSRGIASMLEDRNSAAGNKHIINQI